MRIGEFIAEATAPTIKIVPDIEGQKRLEEAERLKKEKEALLREQVVIAPVPTKRIGKVIRKL